MSSSKPEQICVLGATGSIGTSTLAVLRLHPERYQLFALTANTGVDSLFAQIQEFSPKLAAMRCEQSAQALRERIQAAGLSTEVLHGEEGLVAVAEANEVDTVMAAIVGAAGLAATLAAVRAGKKVLLANKESLVMAGDLFMQAVQQHGAGLLPIDSEHNAIFQCMPADHQGRDLAAMGVRRILLTGSGGPFRQTPMDALAAVTPDQACAHPNWSMGRKISVDSATMMNKGLELIEACYLFNTDESLVDIVVHPQSVIHSMVEYADGSVLAQLGQPDMCTPIAHALAWPERIESGVPSLDFILQARLDFEAPDPVRFPALRLARESAVAGGIAPAVLNAANEVAVAAFLDGRIGFTAIADTVAAVLDGGIDGSAESIDAVIAADQLARRAAEAYLLRAA